MRYSFWSICIVFQSVFFILWWFFLPGGKMRTEQEAIEYRLAQENLIALNNKKEGLQEHLNQWKTDSFLLEKYAREHLGMSYPGEIILV